MPPQITKYESYSALGRDRWMFSKGPGILMYHKVARAPLASNLPSLYVHPSSFRRQMRELAASGLNCLSFGEVAAAADKRLAGYCITFDDGFRNAFQRGLPVLRELGLRSIQFIVAGQIGGEDLWDRAIGEPPQKLMDEVEIREWLAAGQEIGSHTMNHRWLTKIPSEKARAEIFDSKKALEDRFGVPIRYFCYPYGDLNKHVRDMVKEAGYEAAATTEPGVNLAHGDTFLLRRFLVEPKRSLASVPGNLARAWRRRRSK